MTLVSFESIEIKESNEPLVDLANFDFILEPFYFKQGLSPSDKMFLREGIAKKLQEIQKNLKTYKFKIWDGFRPREVQNNIYKKFWAELKQNHPEWDDKTLAQEVGKFVTNANDPNRIPPHATGGAVDLTLVDLLGKELDMGTEFDHFGPQAAALYFEQNQISENIKNNRKLLREAMQTANFRADDDEWWHFDYGNQLWASSLNKPTAIYGEAKLPTN